MIKCLTLALIVIMVPIIGHCDEYVHGYTRSNGT